MPSVLSHRVNPYTAQLRNTVVMDASAAHATRTSFDAYAAAVYRVACHLTVGRQDEAESLLIATFEALRGAVERGDDIDDVGGWMVLEAHRRHLDVDGRCDLGTGVRKRSGEPIVDSVDAGPWAGPLDVLRSMPRRDRALLSLVDVERIPPTSAADVVGPLPDSDSALDTARLALAERGGSVLSAFAATERWFDDDQRAAIADRLTALSATHEESIVATTARGRSADQARSVAPRRTAAAFAVVGCAAIVAIGWFAIRPAATTSTTRPLESTAATVPTAGESVLIPLATGLGDERTIRPDTIVRFSNGRVGLTWSGPCNRPATSIRFTNTRYGVELQLSTASFFVVSCVGMPTAWTAAVAVPDGIDGGRIVPTMSGAGLATTFAGYSESDATTAETSLHANGSAAFGSALLDADNRAWAFVQDCSSLDRIRYADRYYEVRLGSPSTTCTSIDRTPRLVGPGGQQFPYLAHRDGGSTAVPVACAGPSGSATDVTTTPDGLLGGPVITTWDGCSVRPAAISAAHLSAACGWESATVVSFGDPIGTPIVGAGQRFIADPDDVVPNQVAPLLQSVQMPADSDDSGIRIDGAPLFISSSVAQAVFVVTNHGAQRWPVFTPPPYCDGIRG